MLYKFSFGSFFVGLIVLVAGAIITVYHQKLADNFGSGVASYDRFKLGGIITCGVGVSIMLSLHTIPLNWIVQSVLVAYGKTFCQRDLFNLIWIN